MAKKLSAEIWEQRINEAGAGRYEFARWTVDGEFGAHKRIHMKCVRHGSLWTTTPNNIINNQGCPECAIENRSKALMINTRDVETLIADSIKIIGWPDGHSNSKSRPLCKCELCNHEWRPMVCHLIYSKSRCPFCARNRKLSLDEWTSRIDRSISIIDWPNGYKNQYSKPIFHCNDCDHEWITTLASVASTGTGCPRCQNYGFQINKDGFLYALRSECGLYVKVGISNSPKRRHKQLEKRTPFKFNPIEQISGDGVKIYELEKYFHEKYERAGFTGFDGCTEWLICTPQLLEELRELEDVK